MPLTAKLDLVEITANNSISARFIKGFEEDGNFHPFDGQFHRLFLTKGNPIPEKFFCEGVSKRTEDGQSAIEETLITVPEKVFNVANYLWNQGE